MASMVMMVVVPSRFRRRGSTGTRRSESPGHSAPPRPSRAVPLDRPTPVVEVELQLEERAKVVG